MSENTEPCTCTISKPGPCHAPRAEPTAQDIIAIVARQSRPSTHNSDESTYAAAANDACDRAAHRHHFWQRHT